MPTEDERKTEIESWNQKGFVGAFNSPLKSAVAGYRVFSDGKNYKNGDFWVVGSYG